MKADLAKIPSELVRSVVSEAIENQLKTKNYQISVSPATKATDYNFTVVIYRVNFCTENEAKPPTTPSIILKVAPQHVPRRNQFNARPCFLREIYVYDKIFPTFRDFERSKTINIKNVRFVEYPVCYRTVDVDLNECLLLEDLAVRAFSTIDRKTGVMTAEHVHLVMQGLAKFHAISFALKDQQPEKFNELTANLNEVIILKSNIQLRHYLTEQSKNVFNAVASESDLLEKITELYKKESLDIAADCLNLESTGPASVITYGDVWQNNIMFKYDSNGKPIETSFVDWQVARQSSPVIDVAFFIFCSTSKELRDVHYNKFLKDYHDCLSAHIRRLGSDPEKLFPYELMEEHLRKFAKYGLILSTVLLPVITSETDYIPDFESIGENVEKGEMEDTSTLLSDKSVGKLHKRFRDIVFDMIRLKYI